MGKVHHHNMNFCCEQISCSTKSFLFNKYLILYFVVQKFSFSPNIFQLDTITDSIPFRKLVQKLLSGIAVIIKSTTAPQVIFRQEDLKKMPQFFVPQRQYKFQFMHTKAQHHQRPSKDPGSPSTPCRSLWIPLCIP